MSKLIEAIYKDLYAHAELSMQALRTAGIVADQVETIQ
ncbi:metal-dependent amidase/aminoacylase/carboxypeptidase family protein [Paraburkholderia sp. WSM4175]